MATTEQVTIKPVTEATIPNGLTSVEAASRLRALGTPAPATSRSTASIIAGNIFTLFNAIIAVFFVLIMSLGLYADAIKAATGEPAVAVLLRV